ncbi:MAG: hypothetical protein VB085_01920 [Peptococcaceae bacterium]|nr:hypothetical protein [Peptococcaceae bacterium]
MKKPLIIGFCGTAKNTGKTTTMKVVMDGAYAKGLTIALTSIGYDGELVDHITGLPKPRIHALPGTMVAIADSCAKGSTADIEILKHTDIETALGKVVIGRVRKPGLILLAGPTKSVEIRRANEYLKEYGCDLVLVDGALSRIAPMVETDGIIMATGASRTNNIDLLVEETAAIAAAYELPLWPHDRAETEAMAAAGQVVRAGSLLDEAMTEDLLAKVGPGAEAVVLEGIIGQLGFEAIFELGLEKLKGKAIVVQDPIKILVSGAPTELKSWMAKLAAANISLLVVRQVALRLITVNPFYPRYRYATHDYEAAYVDKDKLKESMQKLVAAPVVNVLDETEEEIFARVAKELA